MRWRIHTFLLIVLLGFVSLLFRGFPATPVDDLGKANKEKVETALQQLKEVNDKFIDGNICNMDALKYYGYLFILL
ncbi:hypothetical protein EKA14_26410 [Bacillus mycoides]|nr:hypothetical protein EKA14_26410 [Bacillus mycoides]